MKIFQINCMYQRGSTGKIVYDIHEALQLNNIDSIVCYGRGGTSVSYVNVYKFCSEFEAHIHHFGVRYLGWLRYGSNLLSTKKLISFIEKNKPDIVHIHCINCYCVNIYKLLNFLAANGIITVITNHAEFLYTGNCPHAYDCEKWKISPGCGDCPILLEATGTSLKDRTREAWQKMKASFDLFEADKCVFVGVSPWVKQRALSSSISNRFRCDVIENGVDTNIFFKRNFDCLPLKLNNEKKIVFHATASFSLGEHDLKGGHYLIRLAKMMPDFNFVVASMYCEPIKDIPDNVILWGPAKNQDELAMLYSIADVTVILSKRETFSMVTAESLCCGTPVTGFVAGGPESIAIGNYSSFVEYGNLQMLEKSIRAFVVRCIDKGVIEREAKDKFSKNRMINQYISLYQSLLTSNRKQ